MFVSYLKINNNATFVFFKEDLFIKLITIELLTSFSFKSLIDCPKKQHLLLHLFLPQSPSLRLLPRL